jgi:hypothetical protein
MFDDIREAVYLRGKAAQCARMARSVANDNIARKLEQLALNYARRAAEIETRERMLMAI